MILVVCPLAVAALVGCEREPDVEVYTATVDPAPPPVAMPTMPGTTNRPAPDPETLPLRWDTPAGWTDTGTSNQFRVTTLTAGEADGRVEVAVSRVPGPAGTMTANVNRWRQQLGLPALPEEQVIAEVAYAEHETLPVFLTDQNTDTQRALIAWVDLGDESWFFKATGTPVAIDQHRAGFDALVASIRAQDPHPPHDPHAGHNHD